MGKAKGPPGEGPGEDKTTTARLYAEDGIDLRQLAAMLDISVADAYRRLLSPVVKAALRAELKRKSAKLDKG